MPSSLIFIHRAPPLAFRTPFRTTQRKRERGRERDGVSVVHDGYTMAGSGLRSAPCGNAVAGCHLLILRVAKIQVAGLRRVHRRQRLVELRHGLRIGSPGLHAVLFLPFLWLYYITWEESSRNS